MEARSQQIISNLTREVRGKFQDQNAYLQTLSQLMQQYEAAGLDLIQLKMKYAEIVRSYATDEGFSPSLHTFPGVVQSTPTYSPERMQADSKQLQEMGSVINDLENQKQLIYSQLRRVLEAIVTTSSSASATIDQISMFLSQLIEDTGGGIYGSTTLKPRVV